MFGGNRHVSSSEPYVNSSSAFVVVCAVAFLSYLIPTLEWRLVANPQTVWPLWPNFALLVSVLTLVQRRLWPLLIVASFAGDVLFDLQIGISLTSIGWFILADTVEVLIAAFGLRYCFSGVPRLDSIGALAKYSLFAVILAPFFAAFLSANGIPLGYWSGWRVCFLSESLAMVTITPAILSWANAFRAGSQRPRLRNLEHAIQLTGLVVFSFVAFSASSQQHSLPVLLYSLIPFLLWAALRLGPAGVSTSIIVVTFLTIWGAVHGRGPFAVQGPTRDPSLLQVFLVFAAAPFMILTAVVEERKRAQEAVLEQFNMRMEERVGERMRVARDLHDTLLQSFQGLLMKLHGVTYMLPEQSKARVDLEAVIEQARQAVIEGRDAVHGLRSSTVIANDLARAIGEFGEDLCADGNDGNDGNRPSFCVNVEGTTRDLVPLIRDEVYRIACEAVRNACKHAHASRIEVEIQYGGSQFQLRIRDNGKGLDSKIIEKGGSTGHFGMPGMQERAKLIGGRLDVRSYSGSGAAIELVIPASLAYSKTAAGPKSMSSGSGS